MPATAANAAMRNRFMSASPVEKVSNGARDGRVAFADAKGAVHPMGIV
jgi:hypothetical protein